jgi:hypothetical protein
MIAAISVNETAVGGNKAEFDILNPVQCSATGMAPTMLKKNYGDVLTFWGGGVDTQKTLPFGTPAQVRDQVRERIETFEPCLSFVFGSDKKVNVTGSIGILPVHSTNRQDACSPSFLRADDGRFKHRPRCPVKRLPYAYLSAILVCPPVAEEGADVSKQATGKEADVLDKTEINF